VIIVLDQTNIEQSQAIFTNWRNHDWFFLRWL